jgi:hypothetical protein
MNTRRTTLTLGTAAGGLLAAAFLQTAVASADSGAFSNLFGGLGDSGSGLFGDFLGSGANTGTTAATAFGLVDPSQEAVLTVSGIPPLDQQVEGTQTFDFVGPGAPATADSIGTVNTDVSTLTTPIGFTNTEYLVTGSSFDDAKSLGTDATRLGGLPADGSTYDIARFDGFENIYSSVAPEAAQRMPELTTMAPGAGDLLTTAPGAGQDLVSDTFVTPFGSFDLTPFIGDFNASGLLGGDSFLSLFDPTDAITAGNGFDVLGLPFDLLAAF